MASVINVGSQPAVELPFDSGSEVNYCFVIGEVEDCNGVLGGDGVLDECGVCDNDPSNDGFLDECGVCDSDTTNDCTQDCEGIWGGTVTDCGNVTVWMTCDENFEQIRWGLFNSDEMFIDGGQGAASEANEYITLDFDLEPGFYDFGVFDAEGDGGCEVEIRVDGEFTNGVSTDGYFSQRILSFEVPEPQECGNNVVEGTETCDDGNTETETCDYGEESCTVCNAECAEEAGETSFCGDESLDEDNGEECDDGNTEDGDGCDSTCIVEVVECTEVRTIQTPLPDNAEVQDITLRLNCWDAEAGSPEDAAYTDAYNNYVWQEFTDFYMEEVDAPTDETDYTWADYKMVGTMADGQKRIVFFTDPTAATGSIQMLGFNSDFSQFYFDTLKRDWGEGDNTVDDGEE